MDCKARWTTVQYYSPEYSKFKFTISEQDLFDSKAQVIVNAANSQLGGGGGVDGAIHNRGGQDYANAHKALKMAFGGTDTTDASYPLGYSAMIESGDLIVKNIENVIVVAGPKGPKSDFKRESQLYSAYYNSLLLASDQGKKSIAFPSISTGIFGFPRDRAAAISLRAVIDFMNNNQQTTLTTISIHSTKAKGDPKSGLNYYLDAVK